LTAEDIATMWERVDKSKLVQYKLKVELSPEVSEVIAQSLGQSGVEANASVTQSQSEIFNSVKGSIADKMISYHRNEETKTGSKPGSLQPRFGAP